MERLAHITFVDEAGKDVGVAAVDIRYYRELAQGCEITLVTGEKIKSQSSVSTIQTAIDTLWGEYTTALGDPP